MTSDYRKILLHFLIELFFVGENEVVGGCGTIFLTNLLTINKQKMGTMGTQIGLHIFCWNADFDGKSIKVQLKSQQEMQLIKRTFFIIRSSKTNWKVIDDARSRNSIDQVRLLMFHALLFIQLFNDTPWVLYHIKKDERS